MLNYAKREILQGKAYICCYFGKTIEVLLRSGTVKNWIIKEKLYMLNIINKGDTYIRQKMIKKINLQRVIL